ncbi:MAG: hypothetical protein E7182_02730 [Erysipelotrichaceae bacterium]|nr:hypothetical protein [Erysipelotrichaceae bacterium]
MAQAKKGKLNFRCPVCFQRDLDIDMFYDEEKKEYYCIRCCFHGDEETVRRWNELCKLKYGHYADRLDPIGEDDEPLSFHTYIAGEL